MFIRRKRVLGYTKKSSYFAREILVLISKTRDACTVHKFGMQVVSQVVPARSHVDGWVEVEGRKEERERESPSPVKRSVRAPGLDSTQRSAIRSGVPSSTSPISGVIFPYYSHVLALATSSPSLALSLSLLESVILEDT